MSELILPLALLAEITLIAGLALVACRIWRHDAAARYGVGLAAMVLLWLALPLTLALRAAGLVTLQWRETLYTAPIPDLVALKAPGAATEPASGGNFLVALWAAGSAVVLLRLVAGFFKVRNLRKTASPLPHLSGAAPVYVTEEVSGPVVVGALRPSVLIPSRVLDSLSEEELADVLAHEFAHVARRHLLVAIVQRLTVALFWPHPFVHLLSHQIVEAREEVCDNVVLNSAGRARYARILLRVAECRRPSGHFSASLGLFGPKSHLEKRVKSLLDPHRRISTEMNFTRIATVTTLMVLGVGAFAGARLQTEIVSAVPLDGMTAPETPKVVLKPSNPKKTEKGKKVVIRYRQGHKAREEQVRAEQKRKAAIELETVARQRAKLELDQVRRDEKLRRIKLKIDDAEAKAKIETEKVLQRSKMLIEASRDQIAREKALVESRTAADEAKRKAELDKVRIEQVKRVMEEEVRRSKADRQSEVEALKKALADRERALEQMRRELEKAKAEAEKAKKKKGGDTYQIELSYPHEVQFQYRVETLSVPILNDIPIVDFTFRVATPIYVPPVKNDTYSRV